MVSSRHEIEAASVNASGENSQHQAVVPHGMSLSSNVNMTNCYKHCKHVFRKFDSICSTKLVAYLMMAGYVEGVDSIEEARDKARSLLTDLKEKWGKYDSYSGYVTLRQPSTEPIQCSHKGLCVLENLGFTDLIDLSEIQYNNYNIKVPDQIPPNETVYTAFNPTTRDLESFFAHENTKKLISVLLIRGCEVSQLPKYFHSANFKNLTVLEISGFSCLTSFPTEAISKLTRLRCLNLSHLPIESLPDNLFDELRQLIWLIMRGCSKLCSIPSIVPLTKLVVLDLSNCPSLHQLVFLDIKYPQLQMLDLSYTPIVYGFRELLTPNLTHLSLRGLALECLLSHFNKPHNLLNLEVLDLSKCEHLVSLFPLKNVPRLKQLDLSGCSSFSSLQEGFFDQMPCLVNLDLSLTKVKHLPSFSTLINLRRLSLRGLELDSIEALASVSVLLVELDLAGLKNSSSQELELDFLESLVKLEILNLSHTNVAKLPDISRLVSLKELILADCQQLKVVPNYLQALTNLETLDLSLLDHNSSTNKYELEIEGEGQRDVSFIPVPTSLEKLVLTNRFCVRKLFLKTTVENLEFVDLRGTDAADWVSKLPTNRPQKRIPKPFEMHVIYDGRSNQPSDFEHDEDVPTELDALISHIQKNIFNSSMASSNSSETGNQDLIKKQLEKILCDLSYIRDNIGRLESSRNWKGREGLLQELMDVATYLSPAHFQVESPNLKKLHRTIVKLKLLVPRPETDVTNALELTNKKKKSLFVRRKNKENVVDVVKDMSRIAYLLSSYKSLSENQKHCLLCFSIFPSDEEGDKNTCVVMKSLVIKKKMLIYWWVGEGFIDPTPNEILYPGTTRDEVKTIEETGKQILKVLAEKKFINPVIKKGRESGSCCMYPFVQSFVIERAREEGFFDFNNITRSFTKSGRACLLQSNTRFRSSCEVWAKYISSPKKLESFKTVKTLLNINESMIKIKQEWFSQMKNLRVLHLGIWCSENTDLIEVEDQKFLEDLKRMKHLRLLSLQGMPTIMKLPDSICQLINLIILDLKGCNYLGELPSDIGSLKSLTHLDISNCPLIFKLPKGISLLSKLQVLRGFVITDLYAGCDSQHSNPSNILSRWWEKNKWCSPLIHRLFGRVTDDVCSLRDLLNLKRLTELNLSVNITMFPGDEELHVFKEMKQLRKLKILWERSKSNEDLMSTATSQKSLMCPSGSGEQTKHLDSIEKLELWCYPYQNAPDWLNPSELKNLNKLYIVGGDLRELPRCDTEWNVKSLRLKYLRNLEIKWDDMKSMFPQLVYLETHQCERLTDFPYELTTMFTQLVYHEEGVWKSTSSS